ncbi:MAG: hypothetical protein ACI841_004191 [Planctomycetota bacterium]|jgi:hypothetical protein
MSDSGTLIVFHQAHDALLHFDAGGDLVGRFGGEQWRGAHGLSRVLRDGEEFLWLTDQFSGQVCRTTLDGTVIQELARPKHAVYASAEYSPTWAAEHPIDRRVYVADGYGANLVHVFDTNGKQLESWDGERGAGRFSEPHGIACRLGSDGVEVWVTDRSNHRIQIFDAEGDLLRSSLVCHSPCMFAFHRDQVIVPELFTPVRILDVESLEPVFAIGHNDQVQPHADPQQWWPPVAPEGWSNVASDRLEPGVFNSPHAACFGTDGDIYVVEWIVGGRITRLERARA